MGKSYLSWDVGYFMNKIFRLLFYIATIISIMVIYIFYPNYNDELFPLFMDTTTFFVFLPAYFYFFCGVLPLLCFVLFKNRVIKILLITVIITFTFVNSLNYLSFYSIQMRLLFDFITIIPTLLFWLIVINLKVLNNINPQNI